MEFADFNLSHEDPMTDDGMALMEALHKAGGAALVPDAWIAAQTPESVGNWFSACAKAAGVSGGALHGLRKAMATQMAHAGCSEKQIAAYLGHRGARQAEVYTCKANRELLAADAFRNFDAWVARTRTPVALRRETGRNADLS